MRKFLALLIAIVLSIGAAFADTAGPNNPGYADNAFETGSIYWTASPASLAAVDASFTTITSTTAAASDQLNMGIWGFSIPAGATVNGIEYIFYWKQTVASAWRDTSVLCAFAGVFGGSNLATLNTSTMGTSVATTTYGGPTELWGASSPSPESVNAEDFGVGLQVEKVTETTSSSVQIDMVQCNVYYTPAGGGGAVQSRFMMMGVGN